MIITLQDVLSFLIEQTDRMLEMERKAGDSLLKAASHLQHADAVLSARQ